MKRKLLHQEWNRGMLLLHKFIKCKLFFNSNLIDIELESSWHRVSIFKYNKKRRSKIVLLFSMKTRSGEMEEERYLYGIVGAKVILINGLQPSDIIVRVRDQMNIELPRNNGRCCIVLYILGLCAVENKSAQFYS